MSKIKGIYAASMSILNDDLALDIKKTVHHAEMLIEQGCHGVAIFGSTGQAQLISISEKIDLLNHLALNKYKEKYMIGTGLNSLGETINLMKVAKSKLDDQKRIDKNLIKNHKVKLFKDNFGFIKSNEIFYRHLR